MTMAKAEHKNQKIEGTEAQKSLRVKNTINTNFLTGSNSRIKLYLRETRSNYRGHRDLKFCGTGRIQFISCEKQKKTYNKITFTAETQRKTES